MKTGEIENGEEFKVGSGVDMLSPTSLALSTTRNIPYELRLCQGILLCGAADRT